MSFQFVKEETNLQKFYFGLFSVKKVLMFEDELSLFELSYKHRLGGALMVRLLRDPVLSHPVKFRHIGLSVPNCS